MPRVNKMVKLTLVSLVTCAVATIAPALPAEAARGPEVGTVQVTWVQKGSWPAPASENIVEGEVRASVDCSGVYTNGGKSFVTAPQCLDPDSWRVRDKLDTAFGQMLDTWGSRDGEYGRYNNYGREYAFTHRDLGAPSILMDGEGMMVTRMGELQQNVDGGVKQTFPKPGSKSSKKQAHEAGVALFTLNKPNPAQSVEFADRNLHVNDTATIVWFDDTGINRDAGEVPTKYTTSVQLDSIAQGMHGASYWWSNRISGPPLSPSAIGAPVFVDGKLAGIVGVNPNDTPEVLYIMDSADLRTTLKQYDALSDKPEQVPTQAPSPSESSRATSTPIPAVTITEPPAPSETAAPTSNNRPGTLDWVFVPGWQWRVVGMGILFILGIIACVIVGVRSHRARKEEQRAEDAELLKRMRAAARGAGPNPTDGDNGKTNLDEDQQP